MLYTEQDTGLIRHYHNSREYGIVTALRRKQASNHFV